MQNRLLAALLACLLVSAIVSCGNTPPDNTGTIASEQAVTESTPIGTEPENKLPTQEDYSGRTFLILASDENVPYTYFELPLEETGDVMNDAILDRNRTAEEYLNIKLAIEQDTYRNVENKVKAGAAAGDGAYDVANVHIVQGSYSLVTGGCLYNMAALSNVDYRAPWWNSSFLDTLTIHKADGDYLYIVSGEMIVPNARVMVFNKKMFADLNKGVDIYSEVTEGKWTLDRLRTLTQNAMKDLDGDGVFGKNDRYAFADLDNTGVGTSFLHGSGLRLVTIQGNGEMTLCMEDEKVHILLEKLYEALYRDYETKKTVKISVAEFGEGAALFGSQVLTKLQVLRDYDTDFGILPYPKYDESQVKYYSSIWNALLCVPIDVKDAAAAGKVLDVLNAVSVDTLTPAFQDVLLDSKFSRDEESAAMLDIVFDGLVYDFGFVMDNFFNYYSFLGKMLIAGNMDLTSYAAANREPTLAHYRDVIEAAVKR